MLPNEGLLFDEASDAWSATEVLNRVDLDLAYASEKLLNLDSLYIRILAWHSDFDATTFETDNIPEDFIESLLAHDLLYATLCSEVKELDSFMGIVETLIDSAQKMISSSGQSEECSTLLGKKFSDSEESLTETKERLLEMKMQLAKLQLTTISFNQREWKFHTDVGISKKFELSSIDLKSHMQTAEQKRILRMLEKSLARELDLEKKIAEFKENEDDLRLKLRLTEQVSFCMDEAAEVVWGRFLEAENTAEVLMGISKEMVNRLQIVHFNLNGSVQREHELQVKLQSCMEQLNAKDLVIQNLNGNMSQLVSENSEVSSLREKVQLLEKKLRDSESHLKEANESFEAIRDQAREMENLIESLKETIHDTESRAENAEAKVTQLTETNLELTEELGFLKGNNDSTNKKLTILEKNLSESEIQLQHAKASSEASQEQQNMLYSAIWDMETLIDELKQNVMKAESKTENAEEQFHTLSEANLELTKKLDLMKAQMECLETLLNQATLEKTASAEDIKIQTNLIMSMAMQLATERTRIRKQFYTLRKENKLLREKLLKLKDPPEPALANGICNDKRLTSLTNDSTNERETPQEISTVASSELTKTLDSIAKMKELAEAPPPNDAEIESSNSENASNNLDTELQDKGLAEPRRHNRTYIFLAIIILLVSVSAAYLSNNRHGITDL